MLIDKTQQKISNSKSKIGFTTEGGGDWEVWDRFVTLEGKKAYHIGNVCGTCTFFFERLEGANQSINPENVADQLNQGITKIDSALLEKISKIFPNGDYQVILQEVQTRLITPGHKGDYFKEEQTKLWGIDGFWGMPHYPKTEYYRISTQNISSSSCLFEFLIPIFPHNWLTQATVEGYKTNLHSGQKPTAISLSVLDIKEPAEVGTEIKTSSHWCLAHYLLDGHHKAYAAALTNKPFTLLSFLTVENGVSEEEDISNLLKYINNKA